MNRKLLRVFLLGVLFFGLAGTSRSAVIYHENVNQTVNPGSQFDYDPLIGASAVGADYLRLHVNDGAGSFDVAEMPSFGSWQILLGTGAPLFSEVMIKVADSTAIGDTMDDAAWATWGGLEVWSGGVSQGYHANGETAYYGIRSLVAPATYGYGWIQLQRGVAVESWTILASAFNDSGEILAGFTGDEAPGPGGAVPEPSTIIGFVMGGGLLFAMRRRNLKSIP